MFNCQQHVYLDRLYFSKQYMDDPDNPSPDSCDDASFFYKVIFDNIAPRDGRRMSQRESQPHGRLIGPGIVWIVGMGSIVPMSDITD